MAILKQNGQYGFTADEEAGFTVCTFTEAVDVAEKAVELCGEEGVNIVLYDLTKEDFNNWLIAHLTAGEELADVITDYDNTRLLRGLAGEDCFAHTDAGQLSSNFFEHAVKRVSDEDGTVFGVPCTSDVVALYYNKTLLADIVSDFSELENLSWDSFFDIAQTIKAHYPDTYALPPLTSETVRVLVQSLDKECFNEETKLIDEDAAREIFQKLEFLSENDLIPKDTSDDENEVHEYIAENKCAFVIGTPSTYDKILQYAQEGSSWGVCALPTSGKLANQVSLGGISWVVTQQGNEDKSYEILTNAFGESDEMAQFIAQKRLVPAWSCGCLSDMEYGDNVFDKNVIEFLNALGSEIPPYDFSEYTEKLSQKIFGDGVSFDDLCKGVVSGYKDANGATGSFSEMYASPTIDLLGIVIVKPPIKTEYYEGERFNPSGMVVKAYYNNYPSKIITNYRYSPSVLQLSDKYVTISFYYDDVTVTAKISVTVKARNLVSISVDEYRNNVFQNYTLQKSDFTVTARYHDDSTRQITDFEINPASFDSAGSKIVTVAYTEKGVTVHCNVSVNVYSKLTGVRIAQKPEKLLYNKNDRIDRTGLQVIATYSDGAEKVLPVGSLSIAPQVARFKSGETSADIAVSYTENGIEKSAVFAVYKKTGAEFDDCKISQNMGASGIGFVNLYYGAMTYKFEDFAGTDAHMPIIISRTYNSKWGDKGVGKGWRLNLQQEIELRDGIYYYTDKEGKEHKFDGGFSTDGGRSAIRNEMLGLDLFIKGEYIRLVDRGNNTLEFTEDGNVYRLTAIHRYPSTPTNLINAYSMEIGYDGERIRAVAAGNFIDDNRPKVYFYYGEHLNSINYVLGKERKVAEYTYFNGALTGIAKSSGSESGRCVNVTQFNEDKSYFEVIDKTSKDAYGNFKSLRYDLDGAIVRKYSIGYGEESRDTYGLTYSGMNRKVDKGYSDVILSAYVEHDNLMSVISFNPFGTVAQYSYELNGATGYNEPKRILGASSEGFDYKSLTDAYSDTFDIYRSDFSQTTAGWSGAVVDSYYGICGDKSLKGNSLSKPFTFNTSKADGETLYVSLWIYAYSDFSVTAKLSGAEDGVVRSFNNDLYRKWQYAALPIGKVRNNETINITVNSSSEIYISNVRITKAPYEIPDDIPETVYNSFGNVEKSYRYNPADGSIICTENAYNDDKQLKEQTVTVDGKPHSSFKYEYNSNGLLTSKKRFGKIEPYYLEEINEYDGYVQTAYIDENNVETKLSEGLGWTKKESVEEANSPARSVTCTYYDASKLLKTVSSSNCKNEMSYNEDGTLNTVSSGTDIAFGYDSFGNVSEVKIGDTALVTYEYDWKHLRSIAYANGTKTEYGYDGNDRLISITENDEPSATIAYDGGEADAVTVTHADGVIYQSKSVNKGGITGDYSVTFPEADKVFKVQSLALNAAGNVSAVKTYFGSLTNAFETCTTTTDGDGLITSLDRSGHGASNTYKYDDLYRLTSKETKYNSNTFKVWYNYNVVSGNRVSSRIESESLNSGVKKVDNYRYEYYQSGNVKTVYSSDEIITRYEYDENDRLKREDNRRLGYTFVYEYDGNGNITGKKRYALTDGEVDNLTCDTFGYVYSEGEWKDRLESYNGKTIEYDKSGNPVNYCGKALLWLGRKLVDADGIPMEYDYNGLRLRKGDKRYFWQGETLKAECWDNNYIYYYYDESGVCGMCYNGKEYYYRKNVFGDIIAIYKENGSELCRYYYDAWGNHRIEGDKEIGKLNPFRYRGYYYDEEFGLYYLQSRYYDPEIGRFISADDVSYLNTESTSGLNLYAYCNDNPVMGYDPSGRFAWLIAIAIGVLLFTPIGGLAVQAATSVGCYAGMAISSIWDEEVREDMNEINWNPFNSDEAVVAKSNKVSFYKGVPVLRISGMGGSMSLGAIFLDKYASSDKTIDALNHERGHSTQLMAMGIGNYLIQIGIPSIWKREKYAPWELSASMLGGSGLASGSTQEQQDAAMNYYYWAIAPIANIYNIYRYIFVY